MPLHLPSHPFYKTARDFHMTPDSKDLGGYSWRAVAIEGPVWSPNGLQQNDYRQEQAVPQAVAFYSPQNVCRLQDELVRRGFPRPKATDLNGFLNRIFMLNYMSDNYACFKRDPRPIHLLIADWNDAVLNMYEREMGAERLVNDAYNRLTFKGLYALPETPAISVRNGRRGTGTFNMPFDDEFDEWNRRNNMVTWEEQPRTAFNPYVCI